MSTSFDPGRRDGEWAAQERALSEERTGARPSADVRVAEYRLIARALREPPLDPVPDDFAARTAALAERPAAADEKLEARMQAGLFALLGVAGMLSIALFGAGWLRAFELAVAAPNDTSLGTLASWIGAVVACIAFSSLAGRWFGRRFASRRGDEA